MLFRSSGRSRSGGHDRSPGTTRPLWRNRFRSVPAMMLKKPVRGRTGLNCRGILFLGGHRFWLSLFHGVILGDCRRRNRLRRRAALRGVTTDYYGSGRAPRNVPTVSRQYRDAGRSRRRARLRIPGRRSSVPNRVSSIGENSCVPSNTVTLPTSCVMSQVSVCGWD